MNLTKFIHTKKIKQFNSISKTLLTIATCYCNLGNYKFISTNKKPIAQAMGNFIYYFLLSTFELSATLEFFLSYLYLTNSIIKTKAMIIQAVNVRKASIIIATSPSTNSKQKKTTDNANNPKAI